MTVIAIIIIMMVVVMAAYLLESNLSMPFRTLPEAGNRFRLPTLLSRILPLRTRAEWKSMNIIGTEVYPLASFYLVT